MPQTGLRGPYNLDNATIDAIVTRTSPGAYALGKVDDNTFYVSYVGRSDDDIKSRLKDWVGKYPKFKFEYYDSPKAAFEKECNLYHDFGEKEILDNDKHPQRPDGTNWKCPKCNIFG
ncbi:MAG: hypothetical protein QW279_16015 [Candidatus Jordarchaeaceae archaeon]